MDFIKKHKLTVFIIVAYTVVIVFGYFIYSLLIGSSGMPVYGDRLDGINSVPIKSEQYDKIVSDLTSENSVLEVERPSLNGKIFQVIITVGDQVSTSTAKSLANKVKSALTDEQNNFYDVQVFIKKNYSCTLEATGKIDEDGNFTEGLTVKFASDLSKNSLITDYGISASDSSDYNKKQSYDIVDDGTYTIYGFVKDKIGETKCNVKIVKKASDEGSVGTVRTQNEQNFPIIGYKRKATSDFVWTKDR